LVCFQGCKHSDCPPFFVDMLLWITSGSLLIHVYGAIKKAQPITETIEIIVWVLLLFAKLAFYPS
jgi:hypothetical protein